MAFSVSINQTSSIGRATLRSPTRTAIVSQNFAPKPNVSLGEVNDVSTVGVQNGFTLIFNSNTGKFEAQPASNVTVDITNITGGTF
jgi:hypothetical protein